MEAGMFSEYETAGAARSLHKTRERVRFRRQHGFWPMMGTTRLRQEVEAEIEALIRETTSVLRHGLDIRIRREAALRQRYERMLQSK
jgi:hypothetical protein